jgi:hypothetical protein
MERALYAIVGCAVGVAIAAGALFAIDDQQPAAPPADAVVLSPEAAQKIDSSAKELAAIGNETRADNLRSIDENLSLKLDNELLRLQHDGIPTPRIDGSLHSNEVDRLLFRACTEITDVEDARNLFLWAQNAIFAARKAFPDPYREQKAVKAFMGSVASDGERIVVRLVPIDKRPGESDLDATTRVGGELQRTDVAP